MATKKAVTPKLATPVLTAKEFLTGLAELSGAGGKDNLKFFNDDGGVTRSLSVRMGDIFSLAKEFATMELREVERLLDSEYYEARIGAVSIMDFQARDKKTTEQRRKELYELYIRRHDRINNWDMVDRSAPYVVGGYLYDKPRRPLYKLGKSKDPWERRTAIVATYFFIRQDDTEDTFKIAELLVHDKHELVQKAVGSWVREAGKRDPERLFAWLDKYAATMPRITLRYAVEKLNKSEKDHYMKAGK